MVIFGDLLLAWISKLQKAVLHREVRHLRHLIWYKFLSSRRKPTKQALAVDGIHLGRILAHIWESNLASR